MSKINRVAIIGAGPSGCALAYFLVERGIDVIVYDNHSKPELIVGESNLPAIIPLLRRLKIEDQVADISQIKRGAALRHGNGTRVDIPFERFGTGYSYNCPRPQYDNLIRQRAEAVGVKFVDNKATLEVTTDDPERDLVLSAASLADAGLTPETHPDILIDATGRSRLFSRLLKISAQRGGRDDIAYFAHFESFDFDEVIEGQIVISVLENGWSWQIPLKDKLSVGVVLDKRIVKQYGDTPEQRLESIIQQNPMLAKEYGNAKRVTKVMSYTNYQLISDQGFGKGWVLLGDAFGFVDPMLSPGVFMALTAAETLDKLVFSKPQVSEKNLQKYNDEMNSWHQAWTTLINYFYDGRLLGLSEQRVEILEGGNPSLAGKIAERLFSSVISSLVTGVKTRSRINQSILFHGCRHVLKDQDVLDGYAIKPVKENM